MKKSLFESNPYLRNPQKYRDALVTSVSSSTAVETGASIESIRKQLSGAAIETKHSTTKKKSNSR